MVLHDQLIHEIDEVSEIMEKLLISEYTKNKESDKREVVNEHQISLKTFL
jgi:hypothetical protein